MDFNVLKTTQNTLNRLLELVERQPLRRHFVFEVGTWLRNKPADIDSSLVNGQRLDSRLPCANSKPALNLSKAGFFNLFIPGRGRRRDQRIVPLRAEVPLVSRQEERARNLCLAG